MDFKDLKRKIFEVLPDDILPPPTKRIKTLVKLIIDIYTNQIHQIHSNLA